MQVRVIDFQVWADFMLGTRPNVPVLNATLTMEFDQAHLGDASALQGHIILARARGEILARGTLHANIHPIGFDTPPPGTESVSFYMGADYAMPTHPAEPVTENEAVVGTAIIELGDLDILVHLPEAKVAFTF